MNPQKVAFITGAGTGIGAATAEELAHAGMAVVVTGIHQEPLEAVACRIRESGGKALVQAADVTDYDAMHKLVQQTLAEYGRLDLIMPNAAIHDTSSAHDGDPERWKRVIDTNVTGLLYTVRASLPPLLQQGFGHIIAVTSVSGRITYVGEPVYVASKHAQIAFLECLRQEVTPKGIKVSIVEPGLTATPLVENEFARELMKTIPPLEPGDIARAIRYIFEQPANVVINEITVRPAKQIL